MLNKSEEDLTKIEPSFPSWSEVDDGSIESETDRYEVYRFLKHWYYGNVAPILIKNKSDLYSFRFLLSEISNEEFEVELKRRTEIKLKEFNEKENSFEINDCTNCYYGEMMNEQNCIRCDINYSDWLAKNK